MSIKYAAFPGSGSIPMGESIIRVPHQPAEEGIYNDLFENTFDPSIWTESLTGSAVKTTSPLKITHGAGASSYSLTMQDNSPHTSPFLYEILFKGVVDESVVSVDTTTLMELFCQNSSGSTREASLRFVYEDGSYLVKVYYDNDVSIDQTNYSVGSNVTGLRFFWDTSLAHLYYYEGEWKYGASYPVNFDQDVQVSIGCSDTVQRGATFFKRFFQYPVLSGLVDFHKTGAPWPVSSDADYTHYLCNPGSPGQYSLSIYGTGSQNATLDALESLTVVAGRCSEGETRLCLSNVLELKSDAQVEYACPLYSLPTVETTGDAILENVCWCDGSVDETYGLQVEFPTIGKSTDSRDRSEIHQFFMSDDSAKYGPSHEFVRLHHPNGSLALNTGTDRISLMRTLELSDGKRFYYGVATTPTSNKDYMFSLSYVFSAVPANDLFYWAVCSEDGTVIQEPPADVTSSNYTDPAYVPSTENLEPGRYYLKIQSFGQPNKDDGKRSSADLGGVIFGNVHYGTLTSDQIVGTGSAEPVNFNIGGLTTAEKEEVGTCRIYFEVQESRGYLVGYLYDPCAGTITKHESPTVDVSMHSASVSAIEKDDGDIALFYIETDSDSYYENRSSYIACRNFDGSTFSSVDRLYLADLGAEGRHLYAFDIVKNGDFLEVYYSVEDDRLFIDLDRGGVSKQRRRHYYPCGPRGLYGLSVNIQGWDLTGGVEYFITDEPFLSTFDSMENTLYKRRMLCFSPDEGEKFSWVTPTHIRAYKNEGFGATLVSFLDIATRLPAVCMGGPSSVKCVSIPYHFNLSDRIRTEPANLPGLFDFGEQYNFGVDSFDVTCHNDGMVYSIASRGDETEIAIIDPFFYYENNDNLVDLEPLLNGAYYRFRDRRENYVPEYPTAVYPFMCIGEGKDATENRKLFVSIDKSNQYLLSTIHSSTLNKRPSIYQNNFFDRLPLETWREVCWTPEVGGTSNVFTGSNAIYSNISVAIQNLNATTSTFGATLTEANTYRDKYYMLDRGMMFHARIGLADLADTSFLSDPTLRARCGSGTSAPFYEAKARFRFTYDTIHFEIYDVNTSSYVSVGSTPYNGGDIYDLYILMNQRAENLGEVAFIVKQFNNFEVDETYDFKNLLYTYHIDRLVELEEVANSSSSEFIFEWSGNTSGSDTLEFGFMYEMGYGTLEADRGYYQESTTTKDAATIGVFSDVRRDKTFWRDMDDRRIFGHQENEPDYTYRANPQKEYGRSMNYHWYNGFRFSLSSEVSYRGDILNLERLPVATLESIGSFKDAGIWTSKDDNSDVYLWADAHDSNLDKFVFDTVMVKGANIPQVAVVVKDDLADPWVEVGVIDLRRYLFSDVTGVENVSELVVSFPASETGSVGHTRDNYYFIEDNDLAYAAKVIDSNGSQVRCLKNSSGPNLTSGTSMIYSSGGFVELDDQSYRFVGIKLVGSNTYEGYFTLEAFDFGKATVIPYDQNYGESSSLISGIELDSVSVSSNQLVSFSKGRSVNEYSLEFSTVCSQTFTKLLSSVIDVAKPMSKKVWVFDKFKREDQEFDLCYITEEPSYAIIQDDEETSYSVSIILRSSE